MNQLSQQTRDTIELCTQCHTICLTMAMTHCLETGGEHVRPQHFRLMMDCAEVCATTADLLAHKSQFHRQMCGLCVEVCTACANDCMTLEGMEECIAACFACAEACREMA